MCKWHDETQTPIEELLAALPLPTGWAAMVDKQGDCGVYQDRHPKFEEWRKEANEGVGKLEELTTCPACTLAAIRQRGLSAYCDFKYKEAVEEMWTNNNDAWENDRSLEGTWL